MKKDTLVKIIENRIKTEHKKHGDLNWQEIAAIKICSSVIKNNNDVFFREVYFNSVYRNKIDKELIVVVELEISKTKLQMRNGEIWSKNRLSRYWEYVC